MEAYLYMGRTNTKVHGLRQGSCPRHAKSQHGSMTVAQYDRNKNAVHGLTAFVPNSTPGVNEERNITVALIEGFSRMQRGSLLFG